MLRVLIHLNQLLKKDFIASKPEVDKLDINKRTNDPTSLNNIKTKIDDLDVGKLKTAPVDLKKLSNVAYNEVVKNTIFSTQQVTQERKFQIEIL